MAFHVACPITCRKICFCELGFPVRLQSEKGKNDFLREVGLVERFLNDPWLVKGRESNATVQVKVPKVVVAQAPPPHPPQGSGVGGGRGGEESVKRVVLLNQAAAASVVAENNAKSVGAAGDLALASAKYDAEEEQSLSNVKVTCQLCFSGENEGSEKARKMLPCSSCGKKYHRNCLKSWSKNRDLFHWSQWTCPSCRTCEVCRKTGDPSKFMFCKRCDGAYHCYCQHPPHKNVGHGPYLCPKHTKCHGCGSSVPGNGLSVRWFLGYTCCDACGRLFVKGNYCPVCLKVYRDSESTPMVCCDICQRWVHLPCDGISDAKYVQFQVDGNLQYTCPTCRGECSQIRSLEEAVQELWRRRDEADRDLIMSLRAAAGLPTQEEIFDISPFSDDEESEPVVANEFSRSLKFSLKGFGDSSPRKSKEYPKKSSKKKHGKKRASETPEQFVSPRFGSSAGNKNEEMQFSGVPVSSSPVVGSLTDGVSPVNETSLPKQKYVEEVMPVNVPKTARTIKIKSNKSQSLTNKEEIGSNSGVPKSTQGPKLVIHLGGRNRNTNSPSRSEPSSHKGPEDGSPMKLHETDRPGTATKYGDQKGHKADQAIQLKGLRPREKEGHVVKFKNANSEVSGSASKLEVGGGHESKKSPSYPTAALGKRRGEEGLRSEPEAPVTKRTRQSSMKHAEDGSASTGLNEDTIGTPSLAQASATDRKPFLKFKIPRNSSDANQHVSTRSSNGNNQSSVSLPGKEEITYTRGQRSKRRRPAVADEESSQGRRENNSMTELMDANWILQKLGKDASGKRVEIHHPSDDSWHRGTVVEVIEDTSKVSIALDDSTVKSYELGKQGIRFVSQKQKH